MIHLPRVATVGRHVARHRLRGAAALGLALLAACGSGSSPVTLPPAAPEVIAGVLPAGEDVRVERVVDGDTLVVDGRRIRVIGVDTPETVKPGAEVECFGPEASAATRALLPPGEPIRLVSDRERRDRYDRELAYVYRVRDRVFVPAYLLREGFARSLSIPPNVRHRADFTRLEAEARSAGRGLWSAC